MTISSTTTRVQYNGNGATTAFAVPFEFLQAAGVKVIFTDEDGVDETWTKDTHYTLTDNTAAATGTVNVKTTPTDYTPASGTTITILRNQPLTQAQSYTEDDPFPAKSHERALDRLSMQVQMLKEKSDRALSFKETSTNSGVVFPEPAAAKVIGWNAGADGLENKVLSELTAAFPAAPSRYIRNNASGVPDVTTEAQSANLDNLAANSASAAGFVAGGEFLLTGANVLRTLRSRFHDLVNSADYCDPADSDHTEGLVDFIAAIAEGGTGVLAPFDHITTDQILIDKMVKVTGWAGYEAVSGQYSTGTKRGSWITLDDPTALTQEQGVIKVISTTASDRRRWCLFDGFGIDGNRGTSAAFGPSGLIAFGRNMTVHDMKILQCRGHGIWAAADLDEAVKPASSLYAYNNWVGYCTKNGLTFGRAWQDEADPGGVSTLLTGDCNVAFGHYLQNDGAGIAVEAANFETASVKSWWNYDGLEIGHRTGAILEIHGHFYDNARSGLRVYEADGVGGFDGAIVRGQFTANGNPTRITSLEARYNDILTLLPADAEVIAREGWLNSPVTLEKAGILIEAPVTDFVLGTVDFGYMDSTKQNAGIRTTVNGAEVVFGGGYSVQGPLASQACSLTQSSVTYFHGQAHDAFVQHPGFTALGRINMNGQRLINAREIGGSAVSALTRDTTLAPTYAVSQVEAGGAVSVDTIDVSGLSSTVPIFIIENGDATNALTFVHGSNLRCPNAANYSLPKRASALFFAASGVVRLVGSIA